MAKTIVIPEITMTDIQLLISAVNESNLDMREKKQMRDFLDTLQESRMVSTHLQVVSIT